jgi:hypothetical protein
MAEERARGWGWKLLWLHLLFTLPRLGVDRENRALVRQETRIEHEDWLAIEPIIEAMKWMKRQDAFSLRKHSLEESSLYAYRIYLSSHWSATGAEPLGNTGEW